MSMDVSALRKEVEDLRASLAAKQAQLASAGEAPAAASTVSSTVAPYSASFGRTAIISVHTAPGKGLSLVRAACSLHAIQRRSPHASVLLQIGQTLRVGGWVKTGRTANKDEFAFLELNDGSTGTNLQVALPRPS